MTHITGILIYWEVCFHVGFSFLKYYSYCRNLCFIPRIHSCPSFLHHHLCFIDSDFTHLCKTSYILLAHFLFAIVRSVGDVDFLSYFVIGTSISEAVFICVPLLLPLAAQATVSLYLWVPVFVYEIPGSHSFVLILFLFLISGRCLG